jgi:hypothetical protein
VRKQPTLQQTSEPRRQELQELRIQDIRGGNRYWPRIDC